jgi:probable rRNA maturation factor
MSVIQVSVNQEQIEINPLQIEKVADRILSVLGYTDVELSIAFVDDEEMTRLNREYRQLDSSTDVLSFSMQEGEFGDVCPELLGDVVISAPAAQVMSDLHHCPLASVLDLLLVHGILHLTGFDHEEGGEEAQRMKEQTLQVLTDLGHSETDFDWYLDSSD